ncbi:carbonic anhydrase [Estrella lausannensis]|uniref:carbonic anhydrase n=1 Tax=Estrella lausannensis TaxID=483423 RepID=A0A0H5E5W2_9BACT|nr:carbonic anhydrase [Estrella lausannensis]CRX38615.1 carbonic anhydrase [Estrella lausannensis]
MKNWIQAIIAVAALALPAFLMGIPPEEGLKRLKEGNQRYVKEDLQHPNRGAERRAELSSKQKPFAIVVACSDSRVSPEIIFDQGIGDVFVVRVAGNVVGPLELDSIEFAALYLKASLVVVLGHESCGAVQATLDNNTQDIEAIAEKIQPAIKGVDPKAKGALEKATKDNARFVADYISKTPVISKLISEKKLLVTTGYLELKEGSVEWGF